MPQSPTALPWVSPASDPLFVYALADGAKENAFWFHVDGPDSTREELEEVARLARSAPELRKAGQDAAEVLRFVLARLEIERAEAQARGQSTYLLAAHHADIVKACADLESALEKAGP